MVKITVTKTALLTGKGMGRFEQHEAPRSVRSVKRDLCAAGSVQEVILDEEGQPLNFGRELRLFSRRQKEALAIRDGGCMEPHCSAPPSYCEAHHIVEWAAEHGRTDIADGVLLCKFHHLTLHNRDEKIVRTSSPGKRDQYWWTYPPGDPRKPVLLHSKSRAMRDLEREGSLG